MSPVEAKLIWLVLNPANVFLAFLVLGAILLFTSRRALGRWLITGTALTAVTIAFAPLELILLQPLQDRFPPVTMPPDNVYGIVVLGGAVDAQESKRQGRLVLNRRSERVYASIDLARRLPNAKLAYTGGAGVEGPSEAELVKPLLLKMGISEARIILETNARDTYENAVLTRELVKQDITKVWLLVTSASHMPRAMGAFRRTGWNVVAYPVDYRRLGEGDETFGRNFGRGLNLVTAALREWISLANYRILGKTNQLFPGP